MERAPALVRSADLVDRVLPCLCAAVTAWWIGDHLTVRALWSDEAQNALIASAPWSQMLRLAFLAGPVPIPYVTALHGWVGLFGDTELALRGFSAVCAVLFVLLIGRAALLLFGDRRTARLAALWAATSYFLVWFGTQTKVYALAGLLGLGLCVGFVQAVRQPGWRRCAAYGALAVIAAHTHTWLILMLGAQAVTSLLLRRRMPPQSFRRLWITYAAAGILTLPWLAWLLWLGQEGATAWIPGPTASTLPHSFAQMTYGTTAVALLAFGIGGWRMWHARRSEPGVLQEPVVLVGLLLSWTLPMVGAWLLSGVSHASMYAVGRYEMCVLAPLLLTLARVSSFIRIRIIYCFLAVSLMALTYKSVKDDRQMVYNYTFTDRSLTQQLLARARDGDAVIATHITWPSFSYYLERLNRGVGRRLTLRAYPQIMSVRGWFDEPRMAARLGEFEAEAEALAEEAAATLGPGNSVWVLYHDDVVSRALLTRLKRRLVLVEAVAPAPPGEPTWLQSTVRFQRRAVAPEGVRDADSSN